MIVKFTSIGDEIKTDTQIQRLEVKQTSPDAREKHHAVPSMPRVARLLCVPDANLACKEDQGRFLEEMKQTAPKRNLMTKLI